MYSNNLTTGTLVRRVLEQLGNEGIKKKKAISITFDDGYTSQYTHTYNMLEEIGIRATYFITSWQDGRRKNEGGDWMSEEQIRSLAHHGHEIACHTTTHTRNPSLEQLTEEWRVSKRYLEEVTGKEVVTHAYPFGYWGQHINRRAQGFFEATRGSSNGWKDTLYNTHSVNVDGYSVNEVKQLVDDFLASEDGHLVVYVHQIYDNDQAEQAQQAGRPTAQMVREWVEYMSAKREEGLIDIIPYYQGVRRLEPSLVNTYKGD